MNDLINNLLKTWKISSLVLQFGVTQEIDESKSTMHADNGFFVIEHQTGIITIPLDKILIINWVRRES